MAHLITHHDPYHVHKILGVLALLHYLRRFYFFFSSGGATAFPSDEPTAYAAAGALLHGLLSWSSLLLPLPKTRNLNKPMIWPEFRLHSICFATRHVVATLLTLTGAWPGDENWAMNALARAAVVLGTVKMASYITDTYGCRENRTTNTMPYPEGVTEEQQLRIKRLYTSAQFGATVTALMDDPTMNFAPLLGIQMAPLLMTLVRKGKISTDTYHRVYSVSLSIGYVLIFWRLLDIENSLVDTFRALVLYNLPFKRCRAAGISARMFWTVTILASMVVYPLFFREKMASAVEEHIDFVRKFVWFGLARTMAYQTITYAPLFLAEKAKVEEADCGSSSLSSKVAKASRGFLNTNGLSSLFLSGGLFCLVQFYGPMA